MYFIVRGYPLLPYSSSVFGMLGRERIFHESINGSSPDAVASSLPAVKHFQPLAHALAQCIVKERCVMNVFLLFEVSNWSVCSIMGVLDLHRLAPSVARDIDEYRRQQVRAS